MKNSKYNRFNNISHNGEEVKVDENKKNTWPADAVVYIGHLPHGFYEEELKSYFSQYGQVLAVKVARSKKTAKSKGYAFVQFKYPEVATIVAETMNGYMLMGKILDSRVLSPSQKNPFSFATSKQYKFINWKRIFMQQTNRKKTPEEIKKYVEGLLKN